MPTTEQTTEQIYQSCKLFGLTAETLTSETLKKSYKKRALLNHPDKSSGNEEIMKKINQAKQILDKFLEDKEKEKARLEKARLEKVRLEKARLEKARQEKARQEKENQTKEKLERNKFLLNKKDEFIYQHQLDLLCEVKRFQENEIKKKRITIAHLTMQKQKKFLNFIIKVITFGYYDRNKKIENELIETKDHLNHLIKQLTERNQQYMKLEEKVENLKNLNEIYQKKLSKQTIYEINKIGNDYNTTNNNHNIEQKMLYTQLSTLV